MSGKGREVDVEVRGTVVNAMQLLRDGQWHTREELTQSCGKDGPKRVRELRYARHGRFSVEVEFGAGNSTSYRINPDELARKSEVVDIVCAGLKIAEPEVDIVDRTHEIVLSNAEIVMLLAYIRRDTQLEQESVRDLAAAMSGLLENKLLDYLPEGVRYPYDLFKELDAGELDDDDLAHETDEGDENES